MLDGGVHQIGYEDALIVAQVARFLVHRLLDDRPQIGIAVSRFRQISGGFHNRVEQRFERRDLFIAHGCAVGAVHEHILIVGGGALDARCIGQRSQRIAFHAMNP